MVMRRVIDVVKKAAELFSGSFSKKGNAVAFAL